MKIGIITICKVNNYGAELQAFATQKKLEQMGHNAEIINYLYYKDWHFKDTPLSQPFVPLDMKGKLSYWIKYRLMSWVVNKVLPIFNGNMRRRLHNYQSFIDESTKKAYFFLFNDNLKIQSRINDFIENKGRCSSPQHGREIG